MISTKSNFPSLGFRNGIHILFKISDDLKLNIQKRTSVFSINLFSTAAISFRLKKWNFFFSKYWKMIFLDWEAISEKTISDAQFFVCFFTHHKYAIFFDTFCCWALFDIWYDLALCKMIFCTISRKNKKFSSHATKRPFAMNKTAEKTELLGLFTSTLNIILNTNLKLIFLAAN